MSTMSATAASIHLSPATTTSSHSTGHEASSHTSGLSGGAIASKRYLEESS
ncbi:hypothetical protein PENANT_c051G04731 [Penicillium antarcticum]|uniref:Uncharacterized protein n=1 Tax=Penicillium antarcticum TaxID=416450 RepID=A0A1V6PRU4_9EURO|nr:hypothetical protein PENANT_c051G04731 [Penicillium antarcticum]